MTIVLFQMGEITAGKVDLKGILLSRGILPREPKAKKPSNKANSYVNEISAFDIETSRLDLSQSRLSCIHVYMAMAAW